MQLFHWQPWKRQWRRNWIPRVKLEKEMFILMFVNNRKPLGTVCQHDSIASRSVHSHNPLAAFLASPNTRDFYCSFILPFNFVKKKSRPIYKWPKISSLRLWKEEEKNRGRGSWWVSLYRDSSPQLQQLDFWIWLSNLEQVLPKIMSSSK